MYSINIDDPLGRPSYGKETVNALLEGSQSGVLEETVPVTDDGGVGSKNNTGGPV